MLMTHEKQLLADFIVKSKFDQHWILDAAILDPKTSGPLIIAYRWAIANT